YENKNMVEDAENLNLYAYYQEISKLLIWPIHPSRLDLALNFSVFYNKVLILVIPNLLAQYAFEEAIAELGTLGKKYYKDAAAQGS
ncbi:hypothetical protein HID58_039415, partial [Brassica napus]